MDKLPTPYLIACPIYLFSNKKSSASPSPKKGLSVSMKKSSLDDILSNLPEKKRSIKNLGHKLDQNKRLVDKIITKKSKG